MNISSILITIVGIIIIIALYVVSRIGQSKLPNKETSLLPDIKDDKGDVFTSVLDDIPASDGSAPVINNNSTTKTSVEKQQIVLFISSADENGLDGDSIKKSLLNTGLNLGDKDIYHFLIENANEKQDQQVTSLFRVASGVEPWTLRDEDLNKKQLVGLSMVMLLPNNIENKAAVTIFLDKADAIASEINGLLKNQKQEILSAEDRTIMLHM